MDSTAGGNVSLVHTQTPPQLPLPPLTPVLKQLQRQHNL